MVNKEWGKDEISELREKLEQFKPNYVLGIREDIFSIKKDLDLEGSAFPTPEKLKVCTPFLSLPFLFFSFSYFVSVTSTFSFVCVKV